MKIYNYDENGFLIGEGVARICPITKKDLIIPASSTLIKPPEKREHYNLFFNGENWEEVEEVEEIEELELSRIDLIEIELSEIDKKKIRAVTDFLLNNDKERLESLEAQAVALRLERQEVLENETETENTNT